MSVKFYKREELEGKPVVDQEARIRGKVEDLAITEDGQVGISIKNDDGEERLLKLDEIKKIADVILLTEEVPAEKEPEPNLSQPESEETTGETTPTNICPNCGYENRQSMNFCVKCGTKLN
jgi:sporulation protein YlmC with PRC-barrel domain